MIQTDPQSPRERAVFTEAPLPNEPATDVKITLDDGTVLRERMVQIETDNGFSLVFTSVKLDADDKVASPVGPRFEMPLSGEQLARLGSAEAIQATIRSRREEVAAASRAHFKGLELAEEVLRRARGS